MDNILHKQTEAIINVLKERALIQKNIVEKAKVHIEKKVHHKEETIHIPVVNEEVEIKKIAVNEYVEIMPQVRYEGDTIIIPVVKEIVVVEKKLLLVEEVYVTKLSNTTAEEKNVILREEEVTVERFDPDARI
jgi:uncharacterized protein (TIGR02271 family)